MPNITGYFYYLTHGTVNNGEAGGAFSHSNGSQKGSASSGNGANDLFDFNAHNSTSTYVDSGKVYPLSLALNFIIKA